MNILFYRYNSICEPDIIAAFTELGHNVKTIDVEITNKDIDGKEVVELLSDTVKNPYNRIFCLIMRSIRIYHHIILTVFSTYLWQPTADTGIA